MKKLTNIKLAFAVVALGLATYAARENGLLDSRNEPESYHPESYHWDIEIFGPYKHFVNYTDQQLPSHIPADTTGLHPEEFNK